MGTTRATGVHDGPVAQATLRIVGHELPGRRVDSHTNVQLGIQRGREVVGAVPADSSSVEFVVPLDVRAAPGGPLDFRGPFAQGKLGARFVYLNWIEVTDQAAFEGFGRVKLLLSDLPPDVTEVLADGGVVRADVDLTHSRGGPVYASVRPPHVRWTVDDDRASPA